MECHLSTILAPYALALPLCGAVAARVLGTVHPNTFTMSVYVIINELAC